MVSPIRFAIIDDEAPAIEVTRVLMEKHTEFVCVATWTDPERALKELASCSPELLFLDVEMPAMSGLAFLSKLDKPPITILVTAYSQYALDAFSLGVREYILKPMSSQRLDLALSNVKQLLITKTTNLKNREVLAFKDGYEQRFIDPRKIICIAAEGNFSNFVLDDGTKLLISEGLRELSQRLIGFGFVRVHKSHLVNSTHVISVKSSQLTMADGSKVTVGRTYQANVKALI